MNDGVILVDKPAGITSAGVVAQIRRRLGRGVRVGHAGTLDPFATGLLLILVGRATRAQRFLMALPKRYEVTARFGARSSTGDPEGLIGLEQALAFLPEVRLDSEQASRASHGGAVRASGVRAETVVRLTDERGLVALAEPRGDGRALKPIVGFRG